MLECAYYKDLKMLEKAGKIRSVECHIKHDLTAFNGEKVGTYELDFSYREIATLNFVAVEVKGKWKDLAWWKWKHFMAQYKNQYHKFVVYPEKNKSPTEWKRKKR